MIDAIGTFTLFQGCPPGPPTNQEVRAQVIGPLKARFALVTRFDAEAGMGARLRAARLVEARRGMPLRTLAKWEFRGDALPEAALQLLVEAARRMGLRVPYTTWADAFTTTSEVAVHHYLNALGAFSVADFGCSLVDASASPAGIFAALELDPNMDAAIELLPPLLRAIRGQPGVERRALVATLRRAVEIVGHEPQEWSGLAAELGALRPV